VSIKEQISKLRNGSTRRNGGVANGSAPSTATVSFDVKNGAATLRFSQSASSPAADYEVSPEWLIFISHYLRARRAFSSDVQMAEVLGLDRTRLIAWKKGSSVPRQEHVRYLADVATTVDALHRVYHPAVIPDWLTAPKLELADSTPVEMLREGKVLEVLQSVNAAEHGSYV
jgi:transcriptional regulator with XRE-family HTH domain